MRLRQNELVELVANLVHDIWCNWMNYMFSKCIKNEDGSLTIPKEYVDRWSRQKETSYKRLPESEKESDRQLASLYISLLK